MRMNSEILHKNYFYDKVVACKLCAHANQLSSMNVSANKNVNLKKTLALHFQRCVPQKSLLYAREQ